MLVRGGGMGNRYEIKSAGGRRRKGISHPYKPKEELEIGKRFGRIGRYIDL
jgi:hypothetical protein